MHKYFFRDSGLRNFIAGNLQQWELRRDQGMLLENAVAHELVQALTPPLRLHFWRSKTKAEVDFVIPVTPPIPLEVKQNARKILWPSRSFRSFVERYGSRHCFAISLSEEQTQKEGERVLHAILPWRIRLHVKDMLASSPI